MQVPLPTSLSMWMLPWCSWTMRLQIARPRPVPFPSSLVVKNGSMTRGKISGAMPTPVSLTSTTNCDWRDADSGGVPARSTLPPWVMASPALVNRFRKTCRSFWRSAKISGKRSSN